MKRECTSQLTFRNPRVSIGFALYAAGLVLAMAFIESVVAGDNDTAELSQSVPAHAPGKWKATGDLGTARFSHTATLLLNGQVLVTGGIGSDEALAEEAKAQGLLGRVNVTTRVVLGEGQGHGYEGPVKEQIRGALAWVLDGDSAWKGTR